MISQQALQFISESQGHGAWETADLTPQGVKLLRQENSDVSQKGWDLIKDHYQINLQEEQIENVSCQWIIPPITRGKEIILYFFGGAFVVGKPEDDLSMTARLACFTGRKICVPRYALAPENPCPAAKNQAILVYRSLVKNYSSVFIVGESAGGNLALGLTLSVASQSAISLPPAVVLFSPWIDLTHKGDSHVILSGQDPTLSIQHFLEPASLKYVGVKDLDDPEQVRIGKEKLCGSEASPLFSEIPVNIPPVLISSGTRDLLLSDCTRIAKKLREKGCSAEIRVAEGMWHVYEWYPQLPEAEESLKEAASFIARFCK